MKDIGQPIFKYMYEKGILQQRLKRYLFFEDHWDHWPKIAICVYPHYFLLVIGLLFG